MTTYFANPYHGNINPSDSTGLKLFQAATKPRDDADRLSCKLTTAQEFVDAMKEDSQNYGWGLLIDTVSDGTDLLSILNHFDTIDLDLVRNHMSDTFYDENGEAIPDDYKAMVAFDIDPANEEDHQAIFFRRVRSNMIGQRIQSSLTKAALKSLKTKRHLYEWTQADGTCYLDGPVMLQILLQKCKPSTRVGVSSLKTKIRNHKLANFGYNVVDMLESMEALRQEIEELGQTHDDIILDMFNALETGKNEKFNSHIDKMRTQWEEGEDFDVDQITTAATTKYNNLLEAKKWKTDGDQRNSKIVALTTQVEELKKQIQGQSSNASGGTSNGRGDRSGAKSSNRGPTLPDDQQWRLKKSFGNHVHKMDKDWYWCSKQHNHGKGMYVTHKEEDHTDWVERKKRNKDQSNSDSAKSGGSSRGKSLQLNDKMRAAMVAKFKCSDQEAESFMKDLEQNSGN